MDHDLIATQLTVSAVIVWVLERLKSVRLAAFIQHNAPLLNRITAAVLAMASAAGIHWTWDGDAGSLLVTGLTRTGIVHGLGAAVGAFVSQEGIYRLFVLIPKQLKDVIESQKMETKP